MIILENGRHYRKLDVLGPEVQAMTSEELEKNFIVNHQALSAFPRFRSNRGIKFWLDNSATAKIPSSEFNRIEAQYARDPVHSAIRGMDQSFLWYPRVESAVFDEKEGTLAVTLSDFQFFMSPRDPAASPVEVSGWLKSVIVTDIKANAVFLVREGKGPATPLGAQTFTYEFVDGKPWRHIRAVCQPGDVVLPATRRSTSRKARVYITSLELLWNTEGVRVVVGLLPSFDSTKDISIQEAEAILDGHEVDSRYNEVQLLSSSSGDSAEVYEVDTPASLELKKTTAEERYRRYIDELRSLPNQDDDVTGFSYGPDDLVYTEGE